MIPARTTQVDSPMIRIYGKKQSRASRCFWVAEEMGLAYEQVPRDTQNGETRSADYLALNPAGKVPVLDDDGFVLRESLAITFYLVRKAATPLWPDDIQAQALVQQWSSWAVTDMEFPLNAMFLARRRGGGEADAGFMAAHVEMAGKALGVLEKQLGAHPYVLGDAFTLGDINAFNAAMLAPMFVDMANYPAVAEWLARCGARPAWQRVQALA